VKQDRVYLTHILDAIMRIKSYVSVGRSEFITTPHWQDAVIRQLEIIGEATKQLSQDVRAENPTVPWRRFAGLRDVLIHNYMGVDLNIIWEVTQNELPTLEAVVNSLLHESGDVCK
jgi:uncharacterized protein with HEPN domain